MVKIIIAGSRGFDNYDFLKSNMDVLFDLFGIDKEKE